MCELEPFFVSVGWPGAGSYANTGDTKAAAQQQGGDGVDTCRETAGTSGKQRYRRGNSGETSLLAVTELRTRWSAGHRTTEQHSFVDKFHTLDLN